MTVIADHVPAHHSPVRHGAHQDSRRQAEAARRRQEALARLKQRRMPLPGQPLPGQVLPGQALSGRPMRGAVRAPRGEMGPRPHMTLVTSASRVESAGRGCSCGSSVVPSDRPALTTREIEVLRTWLKLDSKPAVAEALYISLGTVNTHLTRIRAKYSDVGRAAPTKAALVARAVQDGHMSLEEL
ncbi:helix-turn-helix transcriptional regulator [Gordonia sp. CPCC 206044]|uniref:helix-turn-helix transcriptional regulator n=1 Tax=Gordonia sp. CPCC 206044 TaxID=3140793 RepID=UPI003AF3D5CB